MVRYFLLSKYMSAKRLLQTVSSRCGIENRLHQILDVVCREDASRATKRQRPENLGIPGLEESRCAASNGEGPTDQAGECTSATGHHLLPLAEAPKSACKRQEPP